MNVNNRTSYKLLSWDFRAKVVARSVELVCSLMWNRPKRFLQTFTENKLFYYEMKPNVPPELERRQMEAERRSPFTLCSSANDSLSETFVSHLFCSVIA